MSNYYNFSVVQYAPEQRRGECLNIGIVVYHENRLDVRLASTLFKLRFLNPNVSFEKFEELPDFLNSRALAYKKPEEQYQAIKNIGFVQSLKPGFFTANSVEQYERKLRALLEDLVETPSVSKLHINKGRMQTKIKSEFKKQNLLGNSIDDIDNHLIVPNFPIDQDKNLIANFALKNGSMHITEVLDLSTKDMNEKFKEAALKAVVLDQAREKFSDSVNCYVLFSSNTNDYKTLVHLRLLECYANQVLNFQSKEDMKFYYKHMAELACTGLQLSSNEIN